MNIEATSSSSYVNKIFCLASRGVQLRIKLFNLYVISILSVIEQLLIKRIL